MRNEPDAAWKLVTSATFAARASSTDPKDPRQFTHLRAKADPIAAAIESGSLVFALSTKHPFPWAASLAKFHGWIGPSPDGLRMHPSFTGQLIEACRKHTVRHHHGLNHAMRYRSRSAVVRHEDLLADQFSVLRTLARRFGLEQAAAELKALPIRVLPAHWDLAQPRFREVAFDPEFYEKQEYISRLSADQWDIVKREIDWNLMSRFGYAVDGSTASDWTFSSQDEEKVYSGDVSAASRPAE